MNDNLILAQISIDEVEVTRSCQSVKDLVDERKRKVILLGRGVQLPVVDADSPLRQKVCLDFLTLLVRRDRYFGFLQNNVYWTHPLAIVYGVDNFCIYPFKNFFFHDLPHLWVESSLGLPDRF